MIKLEPDQDAVEHRRLDLAQPVDEADGLELPGRVRHLAARCLEVAEQAQRLGLRGDRGRLLERRDRTGRVVVERLDPCQSHARAVAASPVSRAYSAAAYS